MFTSVLVGQRRDLLKGSGDHEILHLVRKHYCVMVIDYALIAHNVSDPGCWIGRQDPSRA